MLYAVFIIGENMLSQLTLTSISTESHLYSTKYLLILCAWQNSVQQKGVFEFVYTLNEQKYWKVMQKVAPYGFIYRDMEDRHDKWKEAVYVYTHPACLH